MSVAVPAYFDFLISGFRAGRTGRDVHLGYWDEPPSLATPCSAQEFEAAQARLTDLVIDLAALRAGQRVLDVGCGFGGTLEAAAKWPDMRLVGINVDRRQLEICRGLPAGNSALSLLVADACALPLRAASFDRVLCVEAMFHFRSREVFLREAANVLRSGGHLVLSDILLRKPEEGASISAADIEARLRPEYGPWPQLWVGIDDILDAARSAGLRSERVIDVTRQTLPSYRFTAPHAEAGLPPDPSAGSLLRWLHAGGHLTYAIMSFARG